MAKRRGTRNRVIQAVVWVAVLLVVGSVVAALVLGGSLF